MTKNIEKRLGLIIGMHRNIRVKQGCSDFTQIQFIKTSLQHPYEGVSLNSNVCSLATLSRIENGKHQHDYMLIEYFLKKLDIHHRIKESIHHAERLHLRNIDHAFRHAPISKLHEAMMHCDQFYLENHDDVLLAFNHQVFRFINKLFLSKNAERTEYDQLLKIYRLTDPILQHWILISGSWLKCTHPDFWDLEKNLDFVKYDKYLSSDHTLNATSKNYLHFHLKSYLTRFHDESWFKHELNVLLGQSDLNVTQHHTLAEMTHCLDIAKQKNCIKKGQSKLFHALHTYVHMCCPVSKIKFLSDHLIDMLVHEPYPKPITKIISQNALTLCQSQKSYKPLIKLIKLHLENNH